MGAASTTKMKKTSLLLLTPLSAGLLYLGSFALHPPGADRRPVPHAETLPMLEVDGPEINLAELDVAELISGVDYLPAQYGVLETVLEHGSVGERKAAVRELRHLATPEAVRSLSIALGDHDPRVQKAAFEALSRFGGDDALAAIASFMADHDPAMRAQAVEALGDAGGYSASGYLELALRDDDPRVRETAILALGDLNDGRSVNIISTALRDPDVAVRERAVDMLDELNDEALFRVLYPAL